LLPGRKQVRKHVWDARDFNNSETRYVIIFIKFFFFLQGKAPKKIHAILTVTLACFLPGVAKDLSAPLYLSDFNENLNFLYRISKNTPTSNSMKIRPLGVELFYADGQTDCHAEANSCYAQFFERAQKQSQSYPCA